ncbi:MAG: DUF2294 family protein [Solirubrobacteraceae bacterium]|nr:DUF2294 family protein [Solirubrobacteraceae bacterium]
MASIEDLTPGGPTAADISTSVVGVLARYTGRGPSKARTYRADNLVAVLLEETLTQGEQTLVDAGRGVLARDARLALQDAARDDLVEIVERLTGRTVRQFLTATEVDPDLTVLLFLLEPDAA